MERAGRAASRSGGLVALAFLLAGIAAATDVGGSVAGLVRDEARVPQMGATVHLVTSDGRVAQTVKSDYRGWFQFTGLFPGTYAIEVRGPGLAMVREPDIAVASGERTFLDVSMRGLFASLQLAYGSPVRDMSDRWAWILRARHSRRNVLRFQPARRDEQQEFLRKLGGTFEETHGYAEISAGQGSRTDGLRHQQDLGTAFAVATSIFGDHDLTVSGNHGVGGQNLAGGSTAFRTTYSKEVGSARPAVALTVRQLQASTVAGRGMFGPENESQAVPTLETLSLEFGDAVQLSDSVKIEYGLLLESIKFLSRLHVVSPYARAVYEMAPDRELLFSFASGMPPGFDSRFGQGAALRSDVRQLGLFPRVAVMGGRPTVQRSEHVEVAYRERFGRNLVEAAVYRDSIRDAAVTAALPDGLYGHGEFVPDLRAATSTVNGGHYRALGGRVSYARKVRDRLQAALGYGYGGALAPVSDDIRTGSTADLRAQLGSQWSHLLMASVSAELPATATVLTGSYQWSSVPAVVPADPYNDFAAHSAPGLNVVLRQPLPFGDAVPGRFEASAEFRNLLKTGYVPLQTVDGRVLSLLMAIRSYSGALSYIF